MCLGEDFFLRDSGGDGGGVHYLGLDSVKIGCEEVSGLNPISSKVGFPYVIGTDEGMARERGGFTKF